LVPEAQIPGLGHASIEDDMRNSKFIVSAVVSLSVIVGIGAASAADMAPRMYTKAAVVADPAYDWSGFYVGGHFGYLWGKTRVVDDGVLTESGAPTDGVVGGVLAGYNWQTGPLVLGIEGDFGWSNARGHGIAVVVASTPNTYTLNWDGHVVGKIGYAMGHWLFFGTGGVAFADFNFQEGFVPPAPPILSEGGKYVGFSVGAGVEYAFTRNLLGRLQYIYDDFGGKDYTALDGGIYHVSLTSQTVRGALSWKW
jgi:outer membrane immunogenic protein